VSGLDAIAISILEDGRRFLADLERVLDDARSGDSYRREQRAFQDAGRTLPPITSSDSGEARGAPNPRAGEKALA
jgi:hypothetical protein